MTPEAAMWGVIGAAISVFGSVLISLYASKKSARKDEMTTLQAIVEDLGKKYTDLLKDYRTVIDDLGKARSDLTMALSETKSLRGTHTQLDTKYSKLVNDYRLLTDDLNSARGELILARQEVTAYHNQVIELTARVDALNKRNQALEAILREKGVVIPLESKAET